MGALLEIFPDAKWICIQRDVRDVVSSWGNRKGHTFADYGGLEPGIRFYAERWNQAIDYAIEAEKKFPLYVVYYEDLIKNPQEEMRKMMEFCELDTEAIDLSQVKFRFQAGQWKNRIPEEYHELLNSLLEKNLKRLGYI